jgi:hypothetical protein
MPDADFKVYLACCEWVMLNEIAQPETTRKMIAETYAMSIVSEAENGEVVDWANVNAAILKRWSRSGLEYIKKQAWKRFGPGGWQTHEGHR